MPSRLAPSKLSCLLRKQTPVALFPLCPCHTHATVALLNGAGPFRDGPRRASSSSSSSPVAPLVKSLQTLIKRVTLFFAFLYAKQPLRIKQVGAGGTCAEG